MNLPNPEASKHKLYLSSFDLTMPDADPALIASHGVCATDNEFIKLEWCAFKREECPTDALQQLRHNFQLERGDLYGECHATEFCLLASRERDPGFVESDRYKWIGAVALEDNVIVWAWVHPFFRGLGVLQSLMANWFIEHRGMPGAQRPLSKAMHMWYVSTVRNVVHSEHYMNWVIHHFCNELKEMGLFQDTIDALATEDKKRLFFLRNFLTALSDDAIERYRAMKIFIKIAADLPAFRAELHNHAGHYILSLPNGQMVKEILLMPIDELVEKLTP